jgi:hypothetical protein
LENYEIEVILNSGKKYLIENKPWKQGSLRVVQNHLHWKNETKEKIDLATNFYEFYLEWLTNKETSHPTIWFLDEYNKKWGIIKRV